MEGALLARGGALGEYHGDDVLPRTAFAQGVPHRVLLAPLEIFTYPHSPLLYTLDPDYPSFRPRPPPRSTAAAGGGMTMSTNNSVGVVRDII